MLPNKPARAAPVFTINADGWAENVVRMPSPNFDQRAEGHAAWLLVIHNISLPPGRFGGPFIADLFLNQLDYNADPYFEQLRPLRVSAHFLICRDGAIVQFVSTNDRAWHAGASSFGGQERCNDFSIGVELEGTDFEPFDNRQYYALASLTVGLQAAHPLRHVAGHEHIAPGRKSDPGPFFDWKKYKADYRRIAQSYIEIDLQKVDLAFHSS